MTDRGFRIAREGTPERPAANAREKRAHRTEVISLECAAPRDAPYRNLRMFAEQVRSG